MKITGTQHQHPLSDQEHALVYSVDNGHGMSMSCSSYEGAITKLSIVGTERTRSLLGTERQPRTSVNIGTLVGRVAYPLAGSGQLNIGRREYTLQDPKTVHDCIQQDWNVDVISDGRQATLHLYTVLPAINETLMPRMECDTFYRLTADNELAIDYYAKPRGTSLFSPGNYLCWNLGTGKGISGHSITIHAGARASKPLLGELRELDGSAERDDYREHRQVGAGIDGYYLLDRGASGGHTARSTGLVDESFGKIDSAGGGGSAAGGAGRVLDCALRLYEMGTGQYMELFTDFPMVWVQVVGKRNRGTMGVALVPMVPQDSKEILAPGPYRQKSYHCLYRFGYRKK